MVARMAVSTHAHALKKKHTCARSHALALTCPHTYEGCTCIRSHAHTRIWRMHMRTLTCTRAHVHTRIWRMPALCLCGPDLPPCRCFVTFSLFFLWLVPRFSLQMWRMLSMNVGKGKMSANICEGRCLPCVQQTAVYYWKNVSFLEEFFVEVR